MSTAFFIDFTDFEVGFYNVTMTFYDIFGDYAAGQAIVEIRQGGNTTTSELPWGQIVLAGSVSASLIMVAVILAKRKVAGSNE
jgi:hypothetical protein